MKILVLGASGHIGQRLLSSLNTTPWAQATGASRHTPASAAWGGGAHWLAVNSLDLPSLRSALQGMDAVVNCVAGHGTSIADGAQVLVQAARQAGRPRIIHLSTQSVYGPAEGVVKEDHPLDAGLGWYGRAKCQAEQHMRGYLAHGGQAVILRPGCVYGPGSELWVGRIGRWLRAGRLGDLGAAGDGWSNLVHVDDVVTAVKVALRQGLQSGEPPVFNLSAPDSPRWNDYFIDLALALGATPVKRLGSQLQWDAWLTGPPLKLLQIARKSLQRSGLPVGHWSRLPEPLPPGLLRLWAQQLQLDSTAAERQLGLRFTPYEAGLASAVHWFSPQSSATRATGRTAYSA